MPRFFFHADDGISSRDLEGIELRDILEARAEAVRLSGELLREMDTRFWDGKFWKLDVADHAGLPLFTLTFTAVEHPTPPADPSPL